LESINLSYARKRTSFDLNARIFCETNFR